MPHETQEDLYRGGSQIGIRALLIAHGIVSLWGVQMSGIKGGVIGKSLERFEAFVHCARIAAR